MQRDVLTQLLDRGYAWYNSVPSVFHKKCKALTEILFEWKISQSAIKISENEALLCLNSRKLFQMISKRSNS